MIIKKICSIRKACFTLFALTLLTINSTFSYAQNSEATLIGYAVVPDIVLTLDRIEKIAAVVEPDKFKPGVLKAQAGTMLGDPAFENIDRTKSTVIMLFHKSSDKSAQKSMNDIETVVFLPTKDKTRYQKTLEMMNLPNDSNGEILIISNKKSSLLSAQREIKLYRKISALRDQYDMRILVKIDNIMSVYNSEISMLLNQLQGFDSQSFGTTGERKSMASLISIGKIFIYALNDLAAQSKDYQLDVSLNEKSISLSTEHSTVTGSALSRFFDGNPPSVNKSLSLLPERCELTYAGYFDMKRLQDLIDNLLALAVKRDPAVEQHINRDLIDAYKNYTGLFLGEFAVTYGFNSNNQLQVHLAAATDKSSEEYIAINDKFMAIYNEVMSRMGGEYSGLSGYTIQKNFRKSSGIDVHRYVVKMDSSKMMETEKQMMQKMFGNEFTTEYAVTNGYIVASTSPAVLDKIITRTISGGEKAELLSMKAFGTGMDSYTDFDIISFMEKILENTIPAKEDAIEGETKPEADGTLKMLKKLSVEDRTILFSSKYSKGSSFGKYRISTKMITDILRLINEQKKQAIMYQEEIEIPAENESAD